ncbi:hypothetical protein TCAL_10833 [Tigriopus californicus]|uniref:Caspase family p20 domain-containing protein n=1 Tax=Tigriopus californicus TaxID=6832 RepID=A0A553P010_TIGCA|nr:hypothetical protein TCAL_10833 [Tigriopus californicus]
MPSSPNNGPNHGTKNAAKMAYKGEKDKLLKHLENYDCINEQFECPWEKDDVDLHSLLENKTYMDIQKRRKPSMMESVLKFTTTPIKKTTSFFSIPSQIEDPHPWKATLLIVAARQNQYEIVDMLLNKGAKKNVKCSHNLTALHYAAFFGHTETCEKLLARDDLEVQAQSDRGLTALHCAAAANRLDCFKAIMKKATKDKIDVSNQATFANWHMKTSLHFAVENENPDLVEELLSVESVNLNAQDINGYTALAMATELGNISLIAMLINCPRIKTSIATAQTSLLPANLAIKANNFPAFWLLISRSERDEIMDIEEKCSKEEVHIFNNLIYQMSSRCQRPQFKREKYDTCGDGMGLGLIINIEKFQGEGNRQGSVKDLEQMKDTLSYVGCEVFEKHDVNITDEEIRNQLENFQNIITCKNPPFIVVVVMTHGESEGKLLTHNGSVTDTEILSRFNGENCPVMLRKPKIFIFQACRGNGRDKEVSLPIRNRTDSVPFRQPAYSANWSDMLIAYSSVPGHVSYRHKHTGSEFIQKVCEVFKAHVCALEISQMMSLIMKEMDAYTNAEENSKQTCCVEYRGFWKAFYFPEKWQFQARLNQGKETSI